MKFHKVNFKLKETEFVWDTGGGITLPMSPALYAIRNS